MKLIKTLFLAVLMVCLAASVAMAANTVTVNGHLVTVVPDGTTDWDSKVDFPRGMYVVWVAFCPSAATDVLKLREDSATGSSMAPPMRGNTNLDSSIVYCEGGLVHPYLKATDCTFGTAANVKIIFLLVR